MKNPILTDLKKLRKQVEMLKKKKEQKMVLATSVKERNKLMMEIQELEAIMKAPGKLKSFGKTFLRGLGITRRTFWRGIQRASTNLDRNAPEYRELSRGMTKKPMRPTSPMMEMYAPSQQQRVPVRKMKTRKLKKGKKKTMRRRLIRRKLMKKTPSNMMWDLP